MSIKIAHIAVWTSDLERLRLFYTHYFNGVSNAKYVNDGKQFASYFITFDSSIALEIMQRADVTRPTQGETIGLAHIAFGVNTREDVHKMIDQLRNDGYTILGEPRLTGDGFYEAVIADPDGNVVEIVADNG